MDVVPADAFKLAVAAGEVAIEFGQLAPAAGRRGQTGVAVTDRVVLPLEAGRRLLLWLEESLRPHAVALQAAGAKALAPQEAAAAARPGQVTARPSVDRSGERAAELLRLISSWEAPHQYERSLRLSARGIQANRFLLTLNARDIPGDASREALAICDRMGIPPVLRAAAEAKFAMANCVHFGFEGDQDSIICKLYLERAVPPAEARAAHAAGQKVLLHLAFKWDLMTSAAVTTRYHWFPYLTASQIERRLSSLYRDEAAPSFAIASAMLRLAAGRVPAERLQYLEVEEAENERRSFDLNLYDAGLRVSDAQPFLQRMREHFAIRPGQFQALYDQVKALQLGHLAGGLHREGRDFFNLYYGAVGLPQFSKGRP